MQFPFAWEAILPMYQSGIELRQGEDAPHIPGWDLLLQGLRHSLPLRFSTSGNVGIQCLWVFWLPQGAAVNLLLQLHSGHRSFMALLSFRPIFWISIRAGLRIPVGQMRMVSGPSRESSRAARTQMYQSGLGEAGVSACAFSWGSINWSPCQSWRITAVWRSTAMQRLRWVLGFFELKVRISPHGPAAWMAGRGQLSTEGRPRLVARGDGVWLENSHSQLALRGPPHLGNGLLSNVTICSWIIFTAIYLVCLQGEGPPAGRWVVELGTATVLVQLAATVWEEGLGPGSTRPTPAAGMPFLPVATCKSFCGYRNYCLPNRIKFYSAMFATESCFQALAKRAAHSHGTPPHVAGQKSFTAWFSPQEG